MSEALVSDDPRLNGYIPRGPGWMVPMNWQQFKYFVSQSGLLSEFVGRAQISPTLGPGSGITPVVKAVGAFSPFGERARGINNSISAFLGFGYADLDRRVSRALSFGSEEGYGQPHDFVGRFSRGIVPLARYAWTESWRQARLSPTTNQFPLVAGFTISTRWSAPSTPYHVWEHYRDPGMWRVANAAGQSGPSWLPIRSHTTTAVDLGVYRGDPGAYNADELIHYGRGQHIRAFLKEQEARLEMRPALVDVVTVGDGSRILSGGFHAFGRSANAQAVKAARRRRPRRLRSRARR